MLIFHVITGLNNGGAEAVLLRLVTSDQLHGGRHCVVSLMDTGVYAEHLRQAGVCVFTLNFPRGKITVKGLIKLFALMRKIRPDVVQTWMYHSDLIGGLIARLAGIRAIAWGIRHANLDPAYNSRATLFVIKLCAILSRWIPRKIVSCSEKATSVHQAVGYRSDKFVQIPNGYRMDRLLPDPVARNTVRAELNIAEDIFVVGMIARFDVQKNHGNLISALGQLKREGVAFVCVLVGVGMTDSNAELLGWMDSAEVRDCVKLLGPRNDVPAVMNALDVHALSSLGEAFPNVLAEAMACGTPCVTTDVGDAAAIVADLGWVVESQNSDAFAGALKQAYQKFTSDKNSWKKLQHDCRMRIMENFELELMCDRFRSAWRLCLAN